MLLQYTETLPLDIRVEMTRQRVSQMELADRMGWSQGKLAKRLTGRVSLSVPDLENIASALGIDLRIELTRSRAGVR